MPNWAEGTIKLRGRSENIKSALKDMLFKLNDVSYEDNGESLVIESIGSSSIRINKSRRAFIKCERIELYFEDAFEIIEIQNFSQAWAAIPDNFVELSKNHDVDIKIFTFEKGFEFTQEIEISKGEIVKDVCYEYVDYQWEVPFNNLGG